MDDQCVNKKHSNHMLDLAISIDQDSKGKTIVETNQGNILLSRQWPQDCDFQLVAFHPSSKKCDIVWSQQLAEDIDDALLALNRAGAAKYKNSGWYRRLTMCSKGRNREAQAGD
jgi:hypothetical protein